MNRQKRYYLKNMDKINARRRELRAAKKKYWVGPCEVCAEPIRIPVNGVRVCESNDCRVTRKKRLHAAAMRRLRNNRHDNDRQSTAD